MDNRITSEEVASQFAKAIQIMLEWAKQEMLASSRPSSTKPIYNQEPATDQILPDLKRLLKPKEVAEILRVSRSLVYQMLRRGEIPSVRVGSAVRVRPSDLEKYIKRGKEI